MGNRKILSNKFLYFIKFKKLPSMKKFSLKSWIDRILARALDDHLDELRIDCYLYVNGHKVGSTKPFLHLPQVGFRIQMEEDQSQKFLVQSIELSSAGGYAKLHGKII